MLQEKVFKASRKPFNIDLFFWRVVVAFVVFPFIFWGADASLDTTPEATEIGL